MLTEADLVTLLSPFADRLSPAFVAFPTTREAAADAWAQAALSWVAGSTLITPVSTCPGGYAVFRGEMLLCTVGADRDAFARAWYALGLSIAAGMTGWAAVPPAAPPDLEPVFQLGLSGGSNERCLHRLASIVLAWLRTGTATQLTTSLTVNWS